MGRTFQKLLALSLFALLLSSMGVVVLGSRNEIFKERATDEYSIIHGPEVVREVTEMVANTGNEGLTNALGLQAETLTEMFLKTSLPHSPLATPPSSSPPLWNYLLAVHYGYSYCSTAKCQQNLPKDLANLFGIHGLWPSTKPHTTTDPTETIINCSKQPFDVQAVASLEQDLLKSWPNYKSFVVPGTYQKVWNREWVKHGTCTPFDVYGYFRQSLGLYSQLNLQLIFKSGELKPDDERVYGVKEVIDAFKMYNWKQPYLVCEESRKNNIILKELYFCLDPSGTTFEDCSTYYTNSNKKCDGGFLIPAQTYQLNK